MRHDPDPEYFIRTITLRVPDDLHDALTRIARSEGRSLNRMATDVLYRYVAAQDAEPIDGWLHDESERHRRSLLSVQRRLR